MNLFNRCKHDFELWGKLYDCYSSCERYQFRRCKKCGLIEGRAITVAVGCASSAVINKDMENKDETTINTNITNDNSCL